MENLAHMDIETIKDYKKVIDRIAYEYEDLNFMSLVINTAIESIKRNISERDIELSKYKSKFWEIETNKYF